MPITEEAATVARRARGFPERAQVEGVGEEGREVHEGEPSALVGDRVIEDPEERVDGGEP